MEDNLEVYFCEICSESIPLKDLETGTARQVKGKVIGSCCLQHLAPQAAKTAATPASLTAFGVVFLAGLAAATIWLEYRVSTTSGELDGRLETINTSVGTQNERWGSLAGQLEKLADKAGQSAVSSRLGELAGALESIKAELDRLNTGHADTSAGLGKVSRELDAVKTLGEEAGTSLAAISKEVQSLAREVAALAAKPRQAGNYPLGAVEEPVAPAPVAKEAARKDGLPANLAHQVTRLKDSDAGNRFEAVDQLIQSKDPRVREHLLPMLKDPDLFVRRLTAEGLSNFKHVSTVDALIEQLADPEGIVRHTAYASLKTLTGQKIAFDPEASASSRNKAQRQWKQWWSTARATF